MKKRRGGKQMSSDNIGNGVQETTVEGNECGQKPQKTRLRFSRRGMLTFLIGFLAGVLLLTAFSVGGIGGFFTGTTADATDESENGSFDSQVLNSDLPVVLYVYGNDQNQIEQKFAAGFKQLNGKYGEQLAFVKMSYADHKELFDKMGITSGPTLALFNHQELLGLEAGDWSKFETLLHEKYADLIDETENPLDYIMFYKNPGVGCAKGYEIYDTVGELRLFAADPGLNYYQKCSGQTLTGFRYAALASLYGSTANNAVTATVPNLEGASPLTGIDYYMCTNYGLAAETTSESAVIDGDIRYFKEPMAIDSYHVGEIRLIEGGKGKLGNNWLPCDGSAVKISSYQGLYQLIGTKFGGDGETSFCVPDLSGKSPIKHAKYYICVAGTPPSVE